MIFVVIAVKSESHQFRQRATRYSANSYCCANYFKTSIRFPLHDVHVTRVNHFNLAKRRHSTFHSLNLRTIQDIHSFSPPYTHRCCPHSIMARVQRHVGNALPRGGFVSSALSPQFPNNLRTFFPQTFFFFVFPPNDLSAHAFFTYVRSTVRTCIYIIYIFIAFTFPAQPVGGFTLGDLLDKPWSHASSLLPPGTCLHFIKNQHCLSASQLVTNLICTLVLPNASRNNNHLCGI